MSGERFGDYTLLERLNRGAITEVWRARRGNDEVVLKRLLPQLVHDRLLADRLAEEAALAADIDHANVCRVLDAGTADGTPYLAVEPLEGVSLTDTIGRVDRRAAVAVALQVCAGLHHVHELGLVHRDVAPPNLFITTKGTCKLLDFGIARAIDSAGTTAPDLLKGRLGYVAPEYIAARQLDRRSDVFALGVVLFELATGRHPFETGDRAAMMRAAVDTDAPRASALDATVPDALCNVIARALARDRERRFSTARDMALALEGAAGAVGGPLSDAELAEVVRQLGDRDAGPDAAGSTELLFGDSAEPATVRRFRLTVSDGPGTGAQFSSSGARCVIGAHRLADFVIEDPTVSRFHCEIDVGSGTAVVRDLGSSNGTRVNDVAIVEAPLPGRALLSLGNTRLRFSVGDERVRVATSTRARFGGMRGRSVAMRRVFAILERAAQSEVTVLLTGETGTGKDVAAESIHAESPRSDGPFVAVDCGAIPEALLESELFGHERGAFTGAGQRRVGAFEAANGGTLFLDEIGELSPSLQPKLLRALDRKEVRRLGSNTPDRIDVRLIAATNRDLRSEVNDQRFRSDLYYRLAVVQVELPPLRERLDDLPDLVEALLDDIGDSGDDLRPAEIVSELPHHRWPGNIRELRNYLERCALLQRTAPFEEARADPLIVRTDESLRRGRERWAHEYERRYLEAVLGEEEGNISAVARRAGIGRTYLYQLLRRYGLR